MDIVIQTKELKDRTLEFDNAVNDEYILNTEYYKYYPLLVSILPDHFTENFVG